MTLRPYQSVALTTALSVFSFTSLPQHAAAAESHVVPLAELQQRAEAGNAKRAQNLRDLDRLLSLPQSQEALAKWKVSPDRARAAVATLNDEELSQLAQKARAAEQDVQGGIIVGLLALIGLIVVIIIVIAVVQSD